MIKHNNNPNDFDYPPDQLSDNFNNPTESADQLSKINCLITKIYIQWYLLVLSVTFPIHTVKVCNCKNVLSFSNREMSRNSVKPRFSNDGTLDQNQNIKVGIEASLGESEIATLVITLATQPTRKSGCAECVSVVSI